MPIASLALGGASFLFMIGGFFLTAVPIAGSVLSFGAPLLSLTGIVLGGMAMSHAKQDGGNGVALAGLVLNIIAFLLSLAVALTCGLCNACLTSANMNPHSNPTHSTRGAVGQRLGQQLGQPNDNGFAANASRISVRMKLFAIQSSCAADPSGAGAMQQFHPSIANRYQDVACQVDQPLFDAVGRGCAEGRHPCSAVTLLAGTSDASRATDLGLDPTHCYVHTSGTAKVISCRNETTNQFQLIHLENPAGVM